MQYESLVIALKKNTILKKKLLISRKKATSKKKSNVAEIFHLKKTHFLLSKSRKLMASYMKIFSQLARETGYDTYMSCDEGRMKIRSIIGGIQPTLINQNG